MTYTILHASSYRNLNYYVDLEKNGNKFAVLVWDKVNHKTVTRLLFDTMDDARIEFDSQCALYDMTNTETIEPEWNATDFD